MSDDTQVPNVRPGATAGLPDDSGEFPVLTPRDAGASSVSVAGQMQDGDDPADFTVDEVTDHLDRASDDERARVLTAEGEGKARKGVLGDDAAPSGTDSGPADGDPTPDESGPQNASQGDTDVHHVHAADSASATEAAH